MTPLAQVYLEAAKLFAKRAEFYGPEVNYYVRWAIEDAAMNLGMRNFYLVQRATYRAVQDFVHSTCKYTTRHLYTPEDKLLHLLFLHQEALSNGE